MMVFDVVVVGAGGAGMMAALKASEGNDLKVGVLTKVLPTRSATGCAQGGMNAVLKNRDETDTIELHFKDTVKGSGFLADQDAVEFFVSNMPDLMMELDHMGVPYDRDESGNIAQRPFGGASKPRACYSADKIGHVVLHTLYEQCLKNDVQFLNEWQLLSMAVENGEFHGLVAMDVRSGEIHPIQCKSVVIATGGFGRVYYSRTTNPTGSTGDGTAIAFDAGIPIKDPEFIQFHPTGLAQTGILLSEACRGEGGYLLNNRGERFMKNYAPDVMELGTRDLVARCIEQEIKEGRGFGSGMSSHVLMDVRHLGKEAIISKLPGARHAAMTFEGVDIIDEPVPIRPSCHYSMGGIHVTDYKTCATTMDGVHAAGESCSVSVHGANRLGANSVSEVVFFGKYAGLGAHDTAKRREMGNLEVIEKEAVQWKEEFDRVRSKKNGINMFEIRERMGATMWNNLGIYRNGEDMKTALNDIEQLLEEYKDAFIGDSSVSYNQAFVNYLELGNSLKLAKAIALGAIERKESRGSHSRADFDKRDDEKYLKHTLVYKDGAKYRLDYSPVTITTYQPE